jgi:DNA-binding transcriptional LysR family regulator
MVARPDPYGAVPAPKSKNARASDGGSTPELLAPDFTLRQLSYFVAAAHHQSVQRAAEELHVSSPAVSAAIAHLEEALGVKLFVRRHARGLLATDAGNALAIECRNLLGQAWSLGASRGSASREVRGWVHLGCLLTFAPFLIPPLLRDFQRRHAKSRVFWHEGNHESLMEGLQNGAFEIAVLYDFEVPSGIECRPLRTAPLQAVLPGIHPLAKRKVVTAQDLAGEPLVLLDLPSTREYILSAFSAEGVTPLIAYRVQSIMMLRSLVASGAGYSLLNFCPPYTNPVIGSLVTRPLATRLRTPNMVVARSHRYEPTPAASALGDCIAELVRTMEFSATRRRR